MTALARRRDESLAPAFLAALALHLGLLAWIALFGRNASIMPMGTAVPITIVATGPVTDSRKAEAAKTVQEAQTPAPIAQAKPPEAAPSPARATPAPPAPASPAAKARPTPTPKPSPTAKPRPAPDTFSLDALQASLAKSGHAAPARPAMAKRGLAQIETDLQARVDAGHGVSQSDQQGLQQLLQRLWNPNCAVAGADSVVVPVRFRIGPDGRIASQVSAGGREASSDGVLAAAARRAIDAVHQGAPYAAVYRNQIFTVNFNAKAACADR